MGIKQVLSAPRSPWQCAYVERVIGTIRRECVDHVIVFSEAGLYRHLREFADYYHRSRTHLGLEKDTPEITPRPSTRSRAERRDPRDGRAPSSLRTTNIAPPELRTAVELSHSNKVLSCRFIGGPFLRRGPSDLGDAE